MRFLFLLFVLAGTAAAEPAAVPFHHGVNLTGWFQSADVRTIPWSRFGPEDYRHLKSLGVDGVRLPVNFVAFTGPAPTYTIHPLLYTFLDQAVDGLLGSGISVVLDNHSAPEDAKLKADLGGFLDALWAQLAAHYQGRPANLLFEIQNEPHLITDAGWDQVQRRVLATIRKTSAERTVVVTGAQWGGVAGLLALPKYDDPRLVYSFHFYDPMVFTHQGAAWATLQDLKGVAFPPAGKTAPATVPSVPSWYVKQVKDFYAKDPVPTMEASIRQAAEFGRTRGVAVWCGEFGVYNKVADPADRVAWYRTVRGFLDGQRIPWTMWDYKDTFGVFVKDSAEVFDQDLNLPLLEAVGFTAPPQLPPGPAKETKGFWLYRDKWESNSHEGASDNGGLIDFFDTDQPHAGAYSIAWTDVGRYGWVAWEFAPRKDLSELADTAAVSFWVRTVSPRFSFDVRFVDAQGPGPEDLPWRLSATFDQTQIPHDGQWHHMEVPLSEMKVTGAWDGTWHAPQKDAFRWNRVARLELVAEQAPLTGVTLGFDDVSIVADAGGSGECP